MVLTNSPVIIVRMSRTHARQFNFRSRRRRGKDADRVAGLNVELGVAPKSNRLAIRTDPPVLALLPR